MKIIYSHLKQLLPGLKKSPRQVGRDLTMLGFFLTGLEKKAGESILEVEVRQNRGDCLGYYGLAKELAALYRLTVKNEKYRPKIKQNDCPNIKISAGGLVERVIAVRISDLKNNSSPPWLKKFLRLHEINSINAVVDLTNFAMINYGIPCHAFAAEKISGRLNWETNNHPDYPFTSLDGRKINLPQGILQISDREKVVALAGIVGSDNAAVGANTKEIILEMAIYDRAKIRQDSRKLKIITEASSRLDKNLDTELVPQSFLSLVGLIEKYCRGKISSGIFDRYLKKPLRKEILFDPKKPALYAGIPIPSRFSPEILKRLGAKVSKTTANRYRVLPPTIRKDIEREEDLIEEVIRFYGYDKIPSNRPIKNKKLADITPKIIYLIAAAKSFLVDLGYDEIRSLPFVKKEDLIDKKKSTLVVVQNSVNSEFPILRRSMASSLKRQKDRYAKYKLPSLQFFEIGKVFEKQRRHYREYYSLGIYHPSKERLKTDSKKLLAKLGIKAKPAVIKINEDYFIQIDLKNPPAPKSKNIFLQKKTNPHSVRELTGQIISLDANLILAENVSPQMLIKKYKKSIGEKWLWELTITDVYKTRGKYKYTFRASYFNISSAQAKKIHRRAFGL